jgi:hypothetical protein
MTMEYLIGVVLALMVGSSLTLLGMDRDRSLYPAIMMVIAVLYLLFAVMGGSNEALVAEAPFTALFIGLSVAGFRSTLWFVVAALAGHGVYDMIHPHLFRNPGVPAFWPAFCSAYDLVAAVYLAVLISRDRIRAAA